MTNLIDTTKIKLMARENIYTCWTESNVSQDLWTYFNKQLLSDHPILLGGIDCRHSGDFAKNNFEIELWSKLKNYVRRCENFWSNSNQILVFLIRSSKLAPKFFILD